MNFRPASGCDTAFETLKDTGVFVVSKDQPPYISLPLGLHVQSTQHVVNNPQPRSSQEPQRGLLATTTSYNSASLSAPRPQLRPNSSQAALASSQPRPEGYQNCYGTAYGDVPSSAQPPRVLSRESSSTDEHLRAQLGAPVSIYSLPSSSQNVLPSSQPQSQEYDFMNYGTTSFEKPPQSQSRASSSGTRGHSDHFSKPTVYVQDPRSQDERPSSTNNATYPSPFGDRPSFLSTNLSTASKRPTLLPASRVLLPSPNFGNHSSTFGGYNARPVSAPETVSDSQLIDSLPISQMLPPQRVLPFPDRAPTQGTDTIPASSKATLTKKETETKVAKPMKGRAAAKPKPSLIISLPSSSAPTVRDRRAEAIEAKSDKSLPSSAPPKKRTRAHKALVSAPASSAPPRIDSTLEALERTVSRITTELTPPSSRSGNERPPLSVVSDSETNERPTQPLNRDSSPTAQPPQMGQLPNLLPNVQPKEFLDALDVWIRKYHGLPVPQAPMTAKEQLASYAARPDAERAKLIDDMILECLQDENFGKLCDDVERNWKRICLGL
jgi:hypothetical protein